MPTIYIFPLLCWREKCRKDVTPALPYFNPNALRAKQGGSLYHFYDGLWYERAGPRPPPPTYHVRGGHANHLANPTRYWVSGDVFSLQMGKSTDGNSD